MLRHLAVAAAEWDTLGRPDSELYRGARLDATTAWWTSREPDLIALEEAFLIRSSEVAQAERDEWQRAPNAVHVRIETAPAVQSSDSPSSGRP